MIKIIQGYSADVESEVNRLLTSGIKVVGKHFDSESSPYSKVYIDYEMDSSILENIDVDTLEESVVAYIDKRHAICEICIKPDGKYLAFGKRETKISEGTLILGKILYKVQEDSDV